jgi:hypothetical protein
MNKWQKEAKKIGVQIIQKTKEVVVALWVGGFIELQGLAHKIT